jgi:riboflavin kinase / FMN adenylyltransferase
MRIINGSDQVPASARGAALAIGNFDGVHRGHQALIEATRKEARRLGTQAGAVVFEPHPREHFQPDKPHFRLTPLPLKLRLMEEFGIDLAIVLAFDARLAALSADEFVTRVLLDALGARQVVVGYDFRFGKGRSGDPKSLQQAADALGFGVTVIGQVAEAGEVFSSSAIRAELALGDVKGAAQMLGWWWRVTGVVKSGAKRGTGLGFPTANISLPPGTALAHGIYAVRISMGSRHYAGAAYLGTRPTFDDGAAILETFLFDFDGDLYGREIEVEFIDFIRPDRRFDSAAALQAQMDEDCSRAREILSRTGPGLVQGRPAAPGQCE